MQKRYAALALGLTVALTACGGDNIPALAGEQITITGAVAQGRAQEAVAGAIVTVQGGGTATTDANGLFEVKAPKGLTTMTISKPGFASTRVEGLNTAETTRVEEILRPAFDPAATTTPPSMTLSVLEGNPAEATNWKPLKTGEVLNSYGEDITIGVTVKVDRPDMNTFKTGVASLEVAGGTSNYLNAGLTRNFFGDPRGDTTSFTFRAADLLAFKGRVNLHVSAYDLNGNRVHLIQPLNITAPAASTPNKATVVAPTEIKPMAVTYGDNLNFGGQSLQPQATPTADFSQQIASLRGELAAEGITIAPQAAPANASLWVDVPFKYSAKELPRAFELWRSFDGTNFDRVFSAAPTAVKSGAGFLMRDTSPLLTPGTKTYYKVRAVSDAGIENTADSAVASTTPLPRYTVKLLAPAQAQTRVSTAPTFTWEASGASDRTLTRVLVLDRVQAEGMIFAWQSSSLVNKTSATYNVDGRAAQEQLQPYHAYEWQVASVTLNPERNAMAVAADYFNLFNLFPSPQTSVRSGEVNEFVTGGTQ